jgi:septal ring factor EnvC (AmiA/AmiB activator)
MDETRPGDDVERHLQREADELDHRLHQLEDHIDDAQEKADVRRADAEASRVVAGDWDETAPDRPLGDDPEGAVEDGEPARGE